MDRTETSLLQKNWSQSDDEAENYKRRNKDVDVSLPFCFVTIWPKDATPQDLFKKAIKMFEKKDPQHLQLSEKIREKVLERERVIGRLEDQRYYLRRFNLKIGELANSKRSTPTEDGDSHVVSDELMEKKEEEKQRLEGKVKEVEKEFEEIKKKYGLIWSI